MINHFYFQCTQTMMNISSNGGLNNASPEYNTDPEIFVESKYYDPDELKNMKIPDKYGLI